MSEKIVKELRDLGIPRSGIGRFLGVNDTTVGRWENGTTSPSVAELGLLQGLLTVARAAKTDEKARETLTGLLNMTNGKALGVRWMAKYGGLLAVGGIVAVLGVAIAEAIRDRASGKDD